MQQEALIEEDDDGVEDMRMNNISNWEAAKLFFKRNLAKEKFCISVGELDVGHFDMAPCLGRILLSF